MAKIVAPRFTSLQKKINIYEANILLAVIFRMVLLNVRHVD